MLRAKEETNQALICCVTLQKPTSPRAVTGQDLRPSLPCDYQEPNYLRSHHIAASYGVQ